MNAGAGPALDDPWGRRLAGAARATLPVPPEDGFGAEIAAPMRTGGGGETVETRTEAAAAASDAPPSRPLPMRPGSTVGVALLPPLPPPEHLAAYEATLEGAADRFLRLWEQEATHRIEMEELKLRAAVAAQVREVWHSYLGILAAVGVGVWLTVSGAVGFGMAVLIVGLAQLTLLNLAMARRSPIPPTLTGARPGPVPTPPDSRPPTS